MANTGGMLRLSSGTLFTILVRAMKRHGRNKGNYGQKSSGITQANMLKDLLRIFYPESPDQALTTEKANATNIKKGKNLGEVFPVNDEEVRRQFDKAIRENYESKLTLMDELVGKYIDAETYKDWIVKALLELIDKDGEILSDRSFYISQTPVLKDDLESCDEYVLPAFLLGIWHYTVMYVRDNTAGVETYQQWFPENNKKYDFINSIGQRADVEVNVISRATFTPHDDEGDDDDDLTQAFVLSSAPNIPETADFVNGVFILDGREPEPAPPPPAFQTFLNKATEFLSEKKTILYAESPRPFYSIYVCNNLRPPRIRAAGVREPDDIENATVKRLEKESKYIIIEGTGGIGKSMFLTHLFLNSAEEYKTTDRVPVLASLKDYKADTLNMVAFIHKAITEYDSEITMGQVVDKLQNKKLILLLDGLDEIPRHLRESFETDLGAFIKSYPGNTIFVTSRPINDFISYSKFSIFDILPLNKKQALALIEKLEFWNEEAKTNFMADLDRSLFSSHHQFASNPLLLTIMLMTYTSYGEVPEKMHVFYSKAYETMARLHDATKGSFKRPLNTKLTPEKFAEYFSQFCARTYCLEILDFTDKSFATYMDKVIKDLSEEHGKKLSSADFLQDLVENLCIMYYEGGEYHFIHRSFQEYFAAVYFADNEEDLPKVGEFFETSTHRAYSDRTFDMMYDMASEKVDRKLFLPYLENMFAECENEDQEEEYWNFLDKQYPIIYHSEGEVGDAYTTEPESFTYRMVITKKKLLENDRLDDLKWPKELQEWPKVEWVWAYKRFLHNFDFSEQIDWDRVLEAEEGNTELIDRDSLPSRYTDFLPDEDPVGYTYEINTYDLRKNPRRYEAMRKFLADKSFPLYMEYQKVKGFYYDLKSRVERRRNARRLFDD